MGRWGWPVRLKYVDNLEAPYRNSKVLSFSSPGMPAEKMKSVQADVLIVRWRGKFKQRAGGENI